MSPDWLIIRLPVWGQHNDFLGEERMAKNREWNRIVIKQSCISLMMEDTFNQNLTRMIDLGI